MRSHAWRSYLLTASASLLTVFFALFAAVFTCEHIDNVAFFDV